MLLFCGKPAKAGLLFSALVFASLLGGCGVDVSTLNEPTALPGMAVRGNVHGGVYPIQGATIRLMETQSNGVWNATTKSYVGQAKQLLQTTSDNYGNFGFPDSGWTCDSNQYAYITVTSGNTAGSTKNNNVAQIGVIGNCGTMLANTGEIDEVQVFVSELSTIAAAYTLRSFISIDNTNASSGQQIINITAPANNNVATGTCTNPAGIFAAMTCTAAGLAHGFENAYNLVDSVSTNYKLPTGQARAVPPTNPNAYAPQELINTLGNILQSCVDSPGGTVASYATYTPGGSGSTRCGDLFYYATPSGGTPPTNTLQVALNMAQYPTNNVTNLYNLQPRAVFFTPTMNQVPNDLTVSLFYLTETFGGTATQALTNPVGLALDDDDNAYILVSSAAGTSNTQTAVLGMASNGSVLFAGPVNTTYLRPSAIATDSANNVWVTNDNTDSTGALLKVSATNGAISVGTVFPSAAGVAVDKYNDVFVSADSTTASSIQVFYKGTLNGGTANPLYKSNASGAKLQALTLDGSGNVWSLNTGGTSSAAVVYPFTSFGGYPYYNNLYQGTLSTSGGYSGAPNAAGQMFFPLAKQVSTAIYNNGLSANNLGTFTGSSQSGSTYNVPNQAQVDGAGNVFWTDTEASGNVFQFVPPASGSISGGKLNALLPCYPLNGACYLPAVVNSRSMQIDSTGALWYTADANFGGYPIGVVIETFGVGAPSWPQLAYQQPGVVPK